MTFIYKLWNIIMCRRVKKNKYISELCLNLKICYSCIMWGGEFKIQNVLFESKLDWGYIFLTHLTQLLYFKTLFYALSLDSAYCDSPGNCFTVYKQNCVLTKHKKGVNCQARVQTLSMSTPDDSQDIWNSFSFSTL